VSTPILSPRAEDDLKAIAAYYVDKSPRAARTLLGDLQAGIAHIAAYPLAGTPRPELAMDDLRIRSHVVRGYVISYVEGDPLLIARILHGSSDPDFVLF